MPSQQDTGQVFVFYRSSSNVLFEFIQPLNPSNIRRNDRFGWSVDVQGTTIVASSLEEYHGVFNASKTIMEVKTVGKYNDLKIGNTFALQWRSYNTTGSYVMKKTRPIAMRKLIS